MAKGQYVVSLWDYDKETGTVTVPTVVIDETNLVVQSAFMDTFLTSLANVTICEIFKETRTYFLDQITGTPPGDKQAQREKKWLVQMSDDVTFEALTMTIPGADLTLLDADDRGKMDKGLAQFTAIKASIENFYLSKYGNSVTVHDLVFVGRNL